jgi:hypothetical protein
MASDSPQLANLLAQNNPAEPVYRLYAALASAFPLDAQSEEKFGLGGQLLYAGKIDDRSRNLLYAANIAGAASLAASADPTVQRQAIRDGVIDFLVTSLEEALRILKNEIRKRQTVSVGVAIAPDQLVGQMLDRGVLPDLLPPAIWMVGVAGKDSVSTESFLSQGSRQIAYPNEGADEFVIWSVDRNFARWLLSLDGCVQAVVPSKDFLRQRWLRLAPRYLGRTAQRQHGVALNASEIAQFATAARELIAAKVSAGEEPVRMEIQGQPLS